MQVIRVFIITSAILVSSLTFKLSPPTFFIGDAFDDDIILNNSSFNRVNINYDTILIIHGWVSAKSSDNIQMLQTTFFKKNPKINIITMDWSEVAKQKYVKVASKGVKFMAKQLADFLISLNDLGLNLLRLQIIGHSLGAHVAGCAARSVMKKIGIQVSRISGLDPAGPLFYFEPYVAITCPLKKTDALMVDVVHTNAGITGLLYNIGTVNFMANNGILQPGCHGDFTKNPLKEYNNLVLETISCSHSRALYYFNESIDSDRFVSHAHFTKKKTIYGQNIPFGTTGKYYFKTSSSSPFALG